MKSLNTIYQIQQEEQLTNQTMKEPMTEQPMRNMKKRKMIRRHPNHISND
jgi:hypothetical protein